MAVKVVYDATRGLVQENDTTGAGGFVIKDAILSEGVEGATQAVDGAANPGPNLSVTSGISLVDSAIAASFVTVPDAPAANIGQIKTIIYSEDSDTNGGSVKVLGTGLAAGGVELADVGDVLMLIWTGAAWNIVGQTS
tara:strand:- start:289 stop:702 length:414 start_codon:yes stop_codon:yes gene_type:complete